MVCKDKWAQWAQDLERITGLAADSVDGAARCVKCDRPLLRSGKCVLGHAQDARQAPAVYPEILDGVLCYVRDKVNSRHLGDSGQEQLEAIRSWTYMVGQDRVRRPETFAQGVAAVRQLLDLVRSVDPSADPSTDPRLRAAELFSASAPPASPVDFPQERALLQAANGLVFAEWGEAGRKTKCAGCGRPIAKGDRVLEYLSGFYQGHGKSKRTCRGCGQELCRRIAHRYQQLAGAGDVAGRGEMLAEYDRLIAAGEAMEQPLLTAVNVPGETYGDGYFPPYVTLVDYGHPDYPEGVLGEHVCHWPPLQEAPVIHDPMPATDEALRQQISALRVIQAQSIEEARRIAEQEGAVWELAVDDSPRLAS